MTTMIERVAIAMAMATNGGDWTKDYTEEHRELWRKRARAAFVEAREPTEAMCRAPEENRTTGARRSYQAMIDAALAEEPA